MIFSGKRLFIFLALPVAGFYAGTLVQGLRAPLVYAQEPPSVQESPAEIQREGTTRPDRAEMVMKALAAAYPERLGPAEFRNGDWAVFLGGQYYYYAEGRLLPEELKDRAAEYSGQPFYTYQAELPPWTPPSPEYSARMRETASRRRQAVKRSQHFYDALWRVRNQDESWDRVKQIRFLGHPVMVHYSILTQLSLVEERILNEAKTSAEVRRWIDSLGSVVGWNWRNIAATESRSLHSYGVAVDILPESTRGLATYWLWTAENNPEWWAVPYSKRYHPPAEVIRAFEFFGFLWGGKWTVYDTMHFEYRPEILIFSEIPLADLRKDLS